MPSFLQNWLTRRSSALPSAATRAESVPSTSSNTDTTPNISNHNSVAPSLTPATSNTDAASISTDATPKHESTGRSSDRLRHSRSSIGSYNERVLANSVKRKSRRKTTIDTNRTVSGETFVEASTSAQEQLIQESEQALDRDWTLGALPGDDLRLSEKEETGIKRRRSTRLDILDKASELVEKTSSVLGKRGRETVDAGVEKMKALKGDRRTSLRSRHLETPSFEGPMTKKPRFSETPLQEELSTPPKSERKVAKRPNKRWLSQGLYVGQDRDFDARLTESKNKAKKESKPEAKDRKRALLLLPMFAGQRVIENGRTFKLPFDIFNPLPPGQPKPEEWKKTHKSRLKLSSRFKPWLIECSQMCLRARQPPYGKRLSAWNLLNASARPRPAVMKIASIASCSMSATAAIAISAPSIAPTAHSNPYASGQKSVASTISASKYAKRSTGATASAQTALSRPTRLLSNIPARSSLRRNVTAVCMAATRTRRYVIHPLSAYSLQNRKLT